eukprot:Blabericola_migrator_1__83@NODE_101_length_14318_cov_135_243281_g28_i1_p1_GENE_NODE_101_length_14318_cov_135_243281_g28_i1NODE_101_length_14318_cov_135_243281_g28_i1_p1_ORF_typecomplete_len1126_score187_17E1E2_ATPase/PF00122_20/44E1E2_ATPase/PF00122_20/2_7e57E1E2_ATPase/PF00122_20/5_8e03Hydrolase/PF00702_26/3_2e03Hydrolase/PF00702_26/5_8e53Cation_ATPase_C/PF00689_21/3_6e48Cation_ATPase/PF13246_6/1_3e19Cation_ATPase_N/PF00690_26/4_6e17Cation_ATPase_N/PF00690_26/3_4e02Hydrolase_3/PF08282_12/6_4e06
MFLVNKSDFIGHEKTVTISDQDSQIIWVGEEAGMTVSPMTPPASLKMVEMAHTQDARKRSGAAQVNAAKAGLPPYPHMMTGVEACSFFGTNPATGLNDQQVSIARAKYGANAFAEKEGKSLWALIGEQFEDLLVRILLAAAIISFALALIDGHGASGWSAFVEPIVILLILIANAIVSIWQENNAEKSLEALKKLQPEIARVLRNGSWIHIAAEDLVPGDIVEVRVGDKIPADLRVLKIETTTLKMEQSQLTGESAPVYKCEDMSNPVIDCEIQAKANILYGTTTVSHGRATGVVVATGMATEIGIIQAAVVDAAEDEETSPLQQKLDEFAEQLSKVIGVICVVVWLINFNHFSVPDHGSFLRGCIYYFKIAVALAVAAIPEGLPAVITTCLALGTSRMAKRHAIVRKLASVETLGCTTVICSDKTGTLTTNEMSVVEFVTLSPESELTTYKVEGHSFQPVGRIFRLSGESMELFDHIQDYQVALQYLAQICCLCSEAKLEYNEEGKVVRTGEPTEAALKVLVEKLGSPYQVLNNRYLQVAKRHTPEAFCEHWESDYQKLATLEFSRERKSMSVIVRRQGQDRNLIFVKGAPEAILERSNTVMLPDGRVVPLSIRIRQMLSARIDAMASRALRLLAMAVRLDAGDLSHYNGAQHPMHKKLMDSDNFVQFEQHMTFVGMAGLLDPPRPEVAGAVDSCFKAGIKVIMITGDNKLTAEAIAKDCGILDASGYSSSRNFGDECSGVSFTGREFESLSDAQKRHVLSNSCGAIFSRTEPKHKQLIVKTLRSMGEVVAMTGDGVNDAPALKQADIGIAMGLTGTEVAKEAAAMILADDNFNTIVAAVEEGRSIYNNMKAFIRYLISSNIGEVASIFLTAALGIPEGLAPVQLLWVNLVTDGLPATALGFNPPDVDVMRKPPRKKSDLLITPWVLFRYFTIGLYVGIATVGIFIQYYVWDGANVDGHSLVPYAQLSTFGECHKWTGFTANPVYNMSDDPCTFFSGGKVKASTLSLTVLVVIEMLNSLNALSEDHSLLTLPPWANPSLDFAVLGSIALHCLTLYCAPLAKIFGVAPLSLNDWKAVMLWSFPVILIDELLKLFARSHLRLRRTRLFSWVLGRHRISSSAYVKAH